MRWEMECILRPGVGLRKRTGPSITFRIVGRWYKGDRFIVNDVKTVGHYTWYKIEGTSYWSCGKEGSAQYLKKIRDLDPPAPPPPPPPPPPPAPPPEPPYEPPTYNDKIWAGGWPGTGNTHDWYLPTGIQFNDNPYGRNRMGYGRWDEVPLNEMDDAIKAIRYNMDISYNMKDEALTAPTSGGYYSDLQSKIHLNFNRNKTVYPDYNLGKTFAYVFFTRPDLNILSSPRECILSDNTKKDSMYQYLHDNNPLTLQSLTSEGPPTIGHKFLVLLSNEARSYEVQDRVIKTVEHGESFTGAKVMYGLNDNESRSAGEMSIRYIDSVNLDIFKMHLVWVDYISKVSKGIFVPKREYIRNKILDYAGSCYYILCGADGNTILYWEKLVGVFPLNTSENTFSWDSGTLLSKPEINIKYAYSIKCSMNVEHLHEFNSLNGLGNNPKIKRDYDPRNCATGSTLTYSPVIIPSSIGGKFVYRLLWAERQ